MPQFSTKFRLFARLRNMATSKTAPVPGPGTRSRHPENVEIEPGIVEPQSPKMHPGSDPDAKSADVPVDSAMAEDQLTQLAVPSTDSTPAVTLETLPAELRRRILLCIQNLEDLRTLVLASPVFYQQDLLDLKPLLGAALNT
jgi:hypothetical protein